MKAQSLIAAIALSVPAVSFAGHKDHHSHYYEPDCPRPTYYVPGPSVSFHFGGGPSVYTPSRYYAPTRTYVRRSSSSIEASVQRALRREGYYDGAVDGDIGPQSRASIRYYQAENRMEVTGRIDSRLLRSLGI